MGEMQPWEGCIPDRQNVRLMCLKLELTRVSLHQTRQNNACSPSLYACAVHLASRRVLSERGGPGDIRQRVGSLANFRSNHVMLQSMISIRMGVAHDIH